MGVIVFMICLIPSLGIFYYFGTETVQISSIQNKTIPKSFNHQYQVIRDIVYSGKIMTAYNKFIHQFELSQKSPLQTAKDTVPNPYNPLFVRTRTVQYLLEYVELLTKETYADEY